MSFTFEQQKELLMLQHQQALESEEQAKWHEFELEKLRLNIHLCEAEERASLEHYWLDFN